MARDERRAVAVLRQQYRDLARAGDWQRCTELAREIRMLVRDTATTAESTYALGFALEMLGDVSEAKSSYELALFMNRNHEKARRRLRNLATQHP